MRRIAMAIASAGIIAGSLVGAQAANAASTNDTTVNPPAPAPMPVPVVKALDCEGTTGWHGCGPGWFWRDGWRGWNCYIC